MKISTDPEIIEEILTRGVENTYPSRKELEKMLVSGKQIRLYQGFDPSGPDLHIGHASGLRKLKLFQQLGHEVIFLMGDFTGMIGDPSGKSETRVQLSREQVQNNLKSWRKQISQIIDIDNKENPIQIKFNYDWLSKLKFEDILELASYITIQQMSERDMFQKRITEKKPIGLHEFLYPLMQGFDCIAMDVDLEVGGSDQTFNMLMGRTLMKAFKGKEKCVLTLKLLTVDSGKKMGKTEGNMIRLADSPKSIYGAVMSISDNLIFDWMEIVTNIPLSTIEAMQKDMEKGENPMLFKKQLAYEIVKWIKGEEPAVEAQKYFEEAHQEGIVPGQVDEVSVKEGEWKLPELIADQLKLVPSRAEAKRLVSQKAVSINERKVEDFSKKIKIKKGDIIHVGKKDIIKIV